MIFRRSRRHKRTKREIGSYSQIPTLFLMRYFTQPFDLHLILRLARLLVGPLLVLHFHFNGTIFSFLARHSSSQVYVRHGQGRARNKLYSYHFWFVDVLFGSILQNPLPFVPTFLFCNFYGVEFFLLIEPRIFCTRTLFLFLNLKFFQKFTMGTSLISSPPSSGSRPDRS